MKEHTKAVMAGLMDTDGTFGINRSDNNYLISVEFYNNSRKLMQYVIDNFGGTFKTKASYNVETQYRWYPQSREHLDTFLGQIVDHLIIKKAEASLIQDFRNLGFKRKKPLEREALRIRSRWFKNNRGFVETDTLNSFFTRDRNLRQAYVAGL